MNNRRIASLKHQLCSQNRHTELGTLGEQLAAELFSRDYQVQHNLPGQHNGDLTLIHKRTGEILLVEVKTSQRGKDRRWNFQLWKRRKTDHRHADYTLLIAVVGGGNVTFFLVPRHELNTVKKTCIPSNPDTYAGRLATYRQRGRLTL
jgi:hypothetical protein